MSDDDGYRNWFLEDDDWLESLVATIRDSLWDPIPVTIAQLENFLTELTSVRRGNHKVDLRTLESTARAFDLSNLPAASLIALVGISERGSGKPGQGFLSNVPLSHITSIVRAKLGRLRVSDIVGVVKLAARQAGHHDVFDKLDVETVASAVPERALRSCTLAELRATLEGLSTAGIFRGAESAR